MPKVLINKKICDNSPLCGGIEACKTGALYWDDATATILYDEDKCIGCGACAKMCAVQAIRFARTDADAAEIGREFDDDTRRAEDLFVDRYAGDAVLTQLTASADALSAARAISGLCVMEINSDDKIRCLINCIPMREIFDGRDFAHIKVMNPGDELLAELGIVELPALVIFNEGEVIGKVEGYFEDNDAEKGLLISKVKKILG
ncbi:MAG: 4Fe-4S binding protein [Rickettsiales bacterium]|jgi:NAD-dependent dihydropyrimidine dehydrogenase PreA subunit|nr:4Fe-4S binding protein [Rickettsiales bacterium]